MGLFLSFLSFLFFLVVGASVEEQRQQKPFLIISTRRLGRVVQVNYVRKGICVGFGRHTQRGEGRGKENLLAELRV